MSCLACQRWVLTFGWRHLELRFKMKWINKGKGVLISPQHQQAHIFSEREVNLILGSSLVRSLTPSFQSMNAYTQLTNQWITVRKFA